MKKKSVQYATQKNGCSVACPIQNISEPNSHVKNPLNPRNTTIKIYAIKESKNALSSLTAMIQVFLIIISKLLFMQFKLLIL